MRLNSQIAVHGTDPEDDLDIKNSKYSFGNVVLGARQKEARLDEIVETKASNPKFSDFQEKLVAFVSYELRDHVRPGVIDSWTKVSQFQNLQWYYDF